MVRPLIPATEPIRVEGPGDSPYMRVANGVNPPIVLKQVFGEFAAALDPANPASFRIAPAWTKASRDPLRAVAGEAHLPPCSCTTSCARCSASNARGWVADPLDRRVLQRPHGRSEPDQPASFHVRRRGRHQRARERVRREAHDGPTHRRDLRGARVQLGRDFLIPDGMHFEYGGGPLGG